MKTVSIFRNVPAAASILGSVAIAGLLVSAAIPVWAGESTPAEKAETNQLNAQANAGTTASPEQLNGQDGSFNYTTDSPTQTAIDEAIYANHQVQYQAAQDQYNAQQQQYAAQQDAYRLERANYNYLRDRYERRHGKSTYHPTPASLKTFSSLQTPSVAIDDRVEDVHGRDVGYVRDVAVDVNGDAQDVEIRLANDSSVWVDPDTLSYDSEHAIVVTDMTYAELAAQ